MKEFTLYILECADGSFHIGHTDDLGRRLAQHDEGKGSVYTSTRRPLKLIHAEGFETRYKALTMERKLKGWSRAKKEAYMAGDWKAIGDPAKGKHRHQRLLWGASTPLAAQATLSASGVVNPDHPERSRAAAKSKGTPISNKKFGASQ